MEKMSKLVYEEVKGLDKLKGNEKTNETTFALSPLERGFGNTVGVALRRVLLSNITGLALFAVRIEGVDHEFQTIPGVVEDVTALIMNLRKVKFRYIGKDSLPDDEIVKVVLKADTQGPVNSRQLEVLNPSVEIVNKTLELANISSKGSLSLEMYLRSGRGFMSNEENKKFISNAALFGSKIESKLKKGIFIATDSNFSPIEKVNYKVEELNTASTKVEEKLLFTITTDGTIDTKNALHQACEILIGHFAVVGDVDRMKVDIFTEEQDNTQDTQENDLDITQLGLSVRSLNALKRIGKTKASEVAKMTFEELEQTKNLGRKSLDEIQERLKENGYELSKGEE